jgi:hypothetical protein
MTTQWGTNYSCEILGQCIVCWPMVFQLNEGMCDMFTVKFTLANGYLITRVGVTLDELPYVIDSVKRDCQHTKIKNVVLLPLGGLLL